MKSQRRKDTRCELALRSELHRRGFRFRVDQRLLESRRKGDLVFGAAKVVVFVDGCFWHCCPIHATWPKANAEWWRDKLHANVERDRNTDKVLRASGWRVFRVWEHEDASRAADRVARSLREQRVRNPRGKGFPSKPQRVE